MGAGILCRFPRDEFHHLVAGRRWQDGGRDISTRKSLNLILLLLLPGSPSLSLLWCLLSPLLPPPPPKKRIALQDSCVVLWCLYVCVCAHFSFFFFFLVNLCTVVFFDISSGDHDFSSRIGAQEGRGLYLYEREALSMSPILDCRQFSLRYSGLLAS